MGNLLPSPLVDLALGLRLAGFESAASAGFASLVRVESRGDALAGPLARTYAAELDGNNAPGVLDFHTQIAAAPPLPRASPGGGSKELDAVSRFIAVRPCFAVPLAKRVGASTMTENITVGRATNRDIVLRTPGISKLHAWFELQDGAVRVCDAGSKNGTFVGGERLAAREPRDVDEGDTIAFSTIETSLCTMDTLWRLVHSAG